MLGKNQLLSLIQFVALVAPAIAILMQVVLSEDFNISGIEKEDGLPTSFHILNLSLIIISIGGLLIVYRLSDFVAHQSVLLGVILIFGSLPFLAFSMSLTSAKASWSPSNVDFREHIKKQLITSISSILNISYILGWFGITLKGFEFVSEFANIGIIYNRKQLNPKIFAYLLVLLIIIKILLSLWYQDWLTSTKFEENFVNVNTITLTMILITILFVAPVYGIVNIPHYLFGVPKGHFLLNIAHIWAAIVLLVIYSVQINISEEGDIEVTD